MMRIFRERKKIMMPFGIVLGFILVASLNTSSWYGYRTAHAQDVQGQGVQIDISVENVTIKQHEVKRGDDVVFTVTLRNYGEVTEDYIILRLYDGKRLLTKQMIFPHDDWNVKDMADFNLVWNTKNVDPGNYHVKLEAFMLSDMYEDDNEFEVPGTITIND